jgi:hypothetical protein
MRDRTECLEFERAYLTIDYVTHLIIVTEGLLKANRDDESDEWLDNIYDELIALYRRRIEAKRIIEDDCEADGLRVIELLRLKEEL